MRYVIFCRQEGDEYWYRYTCAHSDPETGIRYYNDLASLYFAVPRQVSSVSTAVQKVSVALDLPSLLEDCLFLGIY